MRRTVSIRTLALAATVCACQTSGSKVPGQASSGGDAAPDAVATVDSPAAPPPQEVSSPPTDASGALDQGGGIESLPDANGGGTGGAGGSPGACGALFCESFEDIADGAPPDPAIWTRTSMDIVVDSTRAARGGKKSLHIPPLTTGAKYIRENKTIPMMGQSFFGRVYLWIEKQPLEKPGSLYHWTLLSADELVDFNAGKVLRLGGHIEGAGTNWVRFNFQTHGNPGETGLSDQQLILTPQKWYCFEFYYSLPDNEARIWLDGVEDPKLHWKGPMGGYVFPTAVTWMTFGWAEYQAAKTPWEVWIDEIALDTKKIGCE